MLRLRQFILVLLVDVLSSRIIAGFNQSIQQFPSAHNFLLEKQEPTRKVMENKLRMRELEILLRQTGNANGTNTGSATVTAEKQGPCKCQLGVCTCCSRFLLDTWNQKACVDVTYDPDEFSFTAKISMNDRLLYTRTVSGKNPRPVCVPVPRLPIVRACVRLYNIYFQGRNVHACVNMEGRFQDTVLFKVGFDCIRLGSKGVALIKPEDGGGLGQLEILPDDIPGEDGDDDYDDDADDDDDDDEDDGDDDYF